jgi:hypothetical protein
MTRQTCTTLRALGELKSFWVPVLRRTRNEKPLNLFPCERLSECSLARLRDTAFHRLRLDTNWARPFPHGSVKKFIRTDALKVVAVIYGTDIIILFGDRKLFCYDTKTTLPTFELDIPIGVIIDDISAPLQMQGEYRIALQMDGYAVIVISFE